MSGTFGNATKHPVAKSSDLSEGQMIEVEIGDQKILLARVNGTVHAVEGRCPHYGASLAEGILCGDRVICPWHKACFRVSNGALLEPPSLDGLRRYSTMTESDTIFVSLVEEASQVTSNQANPVSPDTRHFVILGAGAAGVAAAESLRMNGFQGRLTLISAENEPPYDRTKLSKEFLSGNATIDQLPLRAPEFYKQHELDILTTTVTEVSVDQHNLKFNNGSTLAFDSLLIASGSRPRTPNIPGSDLGNVFLLRSQRDAEAILAGSPPGARVVVVGGSFIGLEVASCFGLRKMPTTVVIPEKTTFAKRLGPEVGRIFQRFHEQHGIEFRVNSEVERFEGTGIVRNVVLRSGESLPADIVVIGAGVLPVTEMITGVKRRSDGGIVVDSFLRVAPDVYAAGDVAVFPEVVSGQPARIEHWRVAGQHGRTAAANMAGRNQSYNGVPYFWTNHFGTRFDYVGHTEKWDEVILQGEIEKPQFIAFYVNDGKVVAAAACHRDQEIDALHELMQQNQVPSPEAVRNGVDLVELARNSCQQVVQRPD